jgi:4-hydroxy-3-polyprenylbenzoate decarboxylase
MKKKIIIGISGASGVIYGIRALQHLQSMADVESHLILTDGALTNIAVETDFKRDEITALADVVHRNDNLAATIASGSYLCDAMLILPCSIKTLSGVANSYAENLLVRAADVMLKEQRPLVLAVRETPLHKGHLELMTRAADYGAIILPPMPAFYHKPKTIEDLVDQTIGKCFDMIGLEHNLFQRWGEGSK